MSDNITNKQNGLKQKCNHDYNSDNNTLIGIPSFKMVFPLTFFLKCPICGRIISVKEPDIANKKEFVKRFFT